MTLEFPARICVDGVLVADAFPDWYPILQGSRVNCPPQNRSSDNNDSSTRSDTGSVTGLAGGRVNTRDIPNTIPPLMGQQINSTLRDIADINDLARS